MNLVVARFQWNRGLLLWFRYLYFSILTGSLIKFILQEIIQFFWSIGNRIQMIICYQVLDANLPLILRSFSFFWSSGLLLLCLLDRLPCFCYFVLEWSIWVLFNLFRSQKCFRLKSTFLTLFFIFNIIRIFIFSFYLINIMIHHPIIKIRLWGFHDILGFLRDNRFKLWLNCILLLFFLSLFSVLLVFFSVLIIYLRSR